MSRDAKPACAEPPTQRGNGFLIPVMPMPCSWYSSHLSLAHRCSVSILDRSVNTFCIFVCLPQSRIHKVILPRAHLHHFEIPPRILLVEELNHLLNRLLLALGRVMPPRRRVI